MGQGAELSTIWSLPRFLAFGAPRPGAVVPGKPRRDARIDVIRGVALLMIFVNHMPGNIVAGWTLHNFGFSDAADAFVLLAGVSATLAYGALIERAGLRAGIVKLAARLWTLYLAHVALFVIVCGVVAAAVTRTQNPLYIEAINIQPVFGGDPLGAVFDALTLRYQPFFLDILPLYIVLLALFPAIYFGARISPLGTLILSAVLWQGATRAGLNLPNGDFGGWFFNPFAWQFLFAIGVVIGRALQLGAPAPRARLLDLLAIAYLTLALAVKLSPGNPLGLAALDAWVEHLQLGSDKTNLAWTRVAHVLALAWLAVRLLPGGDGLRGFAAGRHLATIGRHALPVFCTGTVLSIIGQVVLAETSYTLSVQLLVCAVGVMVLAGLGAFLTWFQSNASARATAGTGAGAVSSSQA